MSSPVASDFRERLEALESRRIPASSRAWAWGLGGSLAAAAALALVLSFRSTPLHVAVTPSTSSGGDVDALSPKGNAELSLWLGTEEQAPVGLSEAPILRPGDRVQPAFASPKAGFIALYVRTPAGEQIQLHPAEPGEAARVEAQGAVPLGPSFRLDEELGRYRVVAYFSETTFRTAPLLARDADEAFEGLVLERRFEVRR